MKIGAVFPHQDMPNDPAFMRDWAQMLEDLGFSHILAYDHVLGALHENREPRLLGPYTEKHAFHEPMTLFAHFAACTHRIGLTTGILILPQRQTALVAKQAVQLQLLSQGRFRLGVGTGWNHVEYESLGEDYETRGRRLDEQVELLRELWAKPVLDYAGEHHRVDRAGLLPLPSEPIPIWFGGFTPVAFRRAVRIGDGFILGADLKRNLAAIELLDQYLDEAGRSRQGFGIEAIINHAAGNAGWRSEIETLKQAGAETVSVRIDLPRHELDPPQAPERIVQMFREYWQTVSDLSDECQENRIA